VVHFWCFYMAFIGWNIHFISASNDGRQRRAGRRADPVPQKYTNDSKFILSTCICIRIAPRCLPTCRTHARQSFRLAPRGTNNLSTAPGSGQLCLHTRSHSRPASCLPAGA
jgi:hypothetical protein